MLVEKCSTEIYIPGEGMMGFWFRKGCVSVGVWFVFVCVFVLRRPEPTGVPAVEMVGLGSVLDCDR